MKKIIPFLSILILLCFFACTEQKSTNQKSNEFSIPPTQVQLDSARYNVGFLIMDGVYNTELTAPYDIFQHTIFRKGVKSMNTFMVANTLEPITTFEGMRILPDFNYLKESCPNIDILVIPSAEHHLVR